MNVEQAERLLMHFREGGAKPDQCFSYDLPPGCVLIVVEGVDGYVRMEVAEPEPTGRLVWACWRHQ